MQDELDDLRIYGICSVMKVIQTRIQSKDSKRNLDIALLIAERTRAMHKFPSLKISPIFSLGGGQQSSQYVKPNTEGQKPLKIIFKVLRNRR